jgi:hypothetical protein
MDQKQDSRLSRRGISAAALLGFVAVAAARLLTLPQSVWELDETLFMSGVLDFEPLRHHPHPPGYPLLIGLGKLFALVFDDPFRSLVALSVVASLVGYAALVSAFRRLGGASGSPEAERIGVAGALLFHLSPTMLVYGPLPLSDAPALMFLALFLAAAARLPGSGSTTIGASIMTGVFASGAIGCRPQLALSVLPALAAALWLAGSWRRRGVLLAAFTAACLVWFVPLVVEVGGLDGLARFLTRQAGAVTTWDTAIPRAGQSPAAIAARFVAHPWGQKWTAGPILVLALAGAAALALARTCRKARWKALLPLVVLSGLELGFSLGVMNPRDAVRYALPSLIGVAFAAACGAEMLARRARVPAAAWVATASLCIGFAVYARPILEPRSLSLSPPVQAAEAARRDLPADAVLLVEKDYAAHAAWLLPRFTRFSYEEGMRLFAGRPEIPVWIFGETILPGARTFLWPASDTYGKLTRALYRTTSLSPVPPEQRYDAIRGVLAYEPRSGGAGFRWLEDDAVIRVFPRHAGTVALTLGLPEVIPGRQVPVRISIAGRPAGYVMVPRGEKRRVVLKLPDLAERGEPVEISIRSASSFIPVEAGIGGDPRRLAVQLHGVELLGP